MFSRALLAVAIKGPSAVYPVDRKDRAPLMPKDVREAPGPLDEYLNSAPALLAPRPSG